MHTYASSLTHQLLLWISRMLTYNHVWFIWTWRKQCDGSWRILLCFINDLVLLKSTTRSKGCMAWLKMHTPYVASKPCSQFLNILDKIFCSLLCLCMLNPWTKLKILWYRFYKWHFILILQLFNCLCVQVVWSFVCKIKKWHRQSRDTEIASNVRPSGAQQLKWALVVVGWGHVCHLHKELMFSMSS